jgi:hypothetical protein
MYRFLSTDELPADDKLARRIVHEARDYIIEDNVLWLLHTPRTKKLDRIYAVCEKIVYTTNVSRTNSTRFTR